MGRIRNTIVHILVSILTITSICNAHPVADDEPTQKKPINKPLTVGRQDGEDAGELVGVGAQVGQIVAGVASANVGDIFEGTLPFIEDTDVQNGVGTIFDSLTKPLNMLWAASNKQALKYFGITEPTTRNPLLPANGTAAGVANKQVAVTTTVEPDDGDGDENENRRLQYNNLGK